MKRSGSLRAAIGAEVEAFFDRHEPEESCLVLEGTGPAATRFYVLLAAIGPERLSRMRAVHAFSGGVFAYFGYHALRAGHGNRTIEELVKPECEAAVRRCHHRHPLSPAATLARWVFHKTAFGSTMPITETLDYIFSPEYLSRTLADFSENLKIYLGSRDSDVPVAISASGASVPGAAELVGLPIRDLIPLVCAIPFVYGRADRSDRFYDAVFTKGYPVMLKSISQEGRPTLVATRFRHGQKANVTFVNCFGDRRPKLRMSWDLLKLVLNLPSPEWCHDIEDAFL